MTQRHNWSEHKIEFGKHSGRTYAEMADSQRGYLSWMVQTFKQNDQRRIAANAVLSEMPIPELKAPEPQDETIMLMTFDDGRISIQAPFSEKDRCHRIGQEDSVNVWYMLAEKTIDASIAAMLENKREVIDKITEEHHGLGFNLFEIMKED